MLSRKLSLFCLCAVMLGLIFIFGSCSSDTDAAEATVTNDTAGVFAVGMNPERDYLVVVDDDNEYVFGSAYDKALQGDLIYVSDIYGEPTAIEKGANLAFSLLKQKLREEGTEIELFSGYRTKEEQQEVYDYYGNLEGWADTNKVMKPGFSEHHTGLLLNIVIWGKDEEGNMTWFTETAERQATHPEFKVVHETLADYGFIDRYPAGKEDITGVPCEPYEIRFVGSTKIAHEIMDNNLCLEEYLKENK